MFTGLIAETGSVLSITPTAGATRITVAAPTLAAKLRLGDSIAVSGVCLTALSITGNTFEADLAAETIARTSLIRLTNGTTVNLELPTAAGSPLGGHIVQGHVDGVGKLMALAPIATTVSNQTDWLLTIAVPPPLRRYVVEKGSITVEGISLTVASIDSETITIAIIPHTYAATNLHTLTSGAEVNLEVDVMAKFAEKRAAESTVSDLQLTEAYLIANGY